LTGATGSQGQQGVQGQQGLQGIQGVKGDSGVSVRSTAVVGDSLQITLSTGQKTTAGYVRGSAGIQGVQGVQGLTGATGAQGIQGLTGQTGATGAQGIQGLTGNTGAQGIQGLQGIQGVKGDSGVSVRSTAVVGDSLQITLSTGQKITAGYVRGAAGIQGVQGVQGLTGATGSQGLQGLQGIQGNTGAKGDSGVSVINSKVIGDSLFVTLSTGQTINTGNVRGLTGATGLLNSAASTGVTPYWNGTAWVLNGTNFYNNGSNIGIGTTTPNSSAALEVKDTAKGLLMPRMTMKQRLAITTPATGLMVYQTDSTTGLWYYDGTVWATNYKSTAVDSIITAQPKGTKIGFSASTTWTCPAGVTQITVELWGGAGGGGGSAGGMVGYCGYWWNCYPGNIGAGFCLRSIDGAKGGNGGYTKAVINVVPGNSYSINIGAGGTGGIAGPAPSTTSNSVGGTGGIGGTSSFSTILYAAPGLGGGGSTSPHTTVAGTSCISGTVGADGAISNYNYPTLNIGSRSYIPTSILTQYPSSFSSGGSGAAKLNDSGGGLSMGNSEVGNIGAVGEAGYCIISY